MHDEVTASSKPRRGGTVVRVFKVVAALIIVPVVFIVILVAVVTALLWLALGAAIWFVGVAAGIPRPDAGRRLRSRGLHLLGSGPSRWLIKATMGLARRAWNRHGSSHKA
jgi:hypothetical protein